MQCFETYLGNLPRKIDLWFFLGCWNGKTHICDQVVLAMSTLQTVWNFFYKQILRLLFIYCSQLKFFWRWLWKKGQPTLVTPLEPPMHYIFAARYISCKKTSAFRKSKSWSYNPWLLGERDLCRPLTPVLHFIIQTECLNMEIFYLRYIHKLK